MLYLLRYEEELRDPKSALSGVKDASVAADELLWRNSLSKRHIKV